MVQKAITPPDSSSSECHGSSPEAKNAVKAAAPSSRRGHFKSRLGCFSCKRRRVKCNELRPECSPCRRLGLICEYPAPQSSSTPRTAVRPNPSALNLEDLRFYHQFLTAGFPTLPLRGGEVWAECAAMSYSSECLAHAILGLGASHLSRNCNVNYEAQALQHRVAAIKLVNEQLDKPPQKPIDADILFATLICLLTQSSLMSDNMVDYLTMTRGGNLVATTIIPDFNASIFKKFSPEGHVMSLGEMVEEQPKDLALIEAFRASVLGMEPICQTKNETKYLEALVACIDALKTSSHSAWLHFVPLFMMPSTFDNQEFLAFVKPENYTGKLLLIHMFLLDYVLGRFCLSLKEEPKCPGRKLTILSWTRGLAKSLPEQYRRHIEWPLQYCGELESQDSRYLLSP
ncbi:C6 transcription factor [Metarhizium brunneum]